MLLDPRLFLSRSMRAWVLPQPVCARDPQFASHITITPLNAHLDNMQQWNQTLADRFACFFSQPSQPWDQRDRSEGVTATVPSPHQLPAGNLRCQNRLWHLFCWQTNRLSYTSCCDDAQLYFRFMFSTYIYLSKHSVSASILKSGTITVLTERWFTGQFEG